MNEQPKTATSACPHQEAVGKRWGDQISEAHQAESFQHLMEQRTLASQHPETVEELIAGHEQTVADWNTASTAFTLHGKRYERRQHQLAKSGVACLFLP